MYAIVNIMYGCPFDQAVAQAACPDDPSEATEVLGDGWEFFYSGSSDETPGCLGVLIDEMSEVDMPYEPYSGHTFYCKSVSDLRLTPTEEEKDRVQKMIEAQVPEVRAVLKNPDVWFIWSTS